MDTISRGRGSELSPYVCFRARCGAPRSELVAQITCSAISSTARRNSSTGKSRLRPRLTTRRYGRTCSTKNSSLHPSETHASCWVSAMRGTGSTVRRGGRFGNRRSGDSAVRRERLGYLGAHRVLPLPSLIEPRSVDPPRCAPGREVRTGSRSLSSFHMMALIHLGMGRPAVRPDETVREYFGRAVRRLDYRLQRLLPRGRGLESRSSRDSLNALIASATLAVARRLDESSGPRSEQRRDHARRGALPRIKPLERIAPSPSRVRA